MDFKEIIRPDGSDMTRNLDVGAVVRVVCERAAKAGQFGDRMDVRVGAFVNEFAGCAWDAALQQALTPSQN